MSRAFKKALKKSITYNLLFQCPDYLIVEKPAGVLTHQAGSRPGLADQLIKDFPEIEKVGEAGRPGIVHRLDREASGLLIIARSRDFSQDIKKQFQEKKVKKIYLALVYGRIAKEEGDLTFVIGRAASGRMAARPKEAEGKEAKTHFEVVGRFRNYTFLRLRIATGRTHQIRTHLLAFGHPIVGDRLYQTRRQKIKDPGCGRLFLHAHLLGFYNLAGERVEYKSHLPEELKSCLKNLK